MSLQTKLPIPKLLYVVSLPTGYRMNAMQLLILKFSLDCLTALELKTVLSEANAVYSMDVQRT